VQDPPHSHAGPLGQRSSCHLGQQAAFERGGWEWQGDIPPRTEGLQH